MCEPAMMPQPESTLAELTDHIQIRRFGGQTHGSGGQSRLAVEPGAPEARAGQEVCDRFQAIEKTGAF